jgi:hypothetical protein
VLDKVKSLHSMRENIGLPSTVPRTETSISRRPSGGLLPTHPHSRLLSDQKPLRPVLLAPDRLDLPVSSLNRNPPKPDLVAYVGAPCALRQHAAPEGTHQKSENWISAKTGVAGVSISRVGRMPGKGCERPLSKPHSTSSTRPIPVSPLLVSVPRRPVLLRRRPMSAPSENLLVRRDERVTPP